MMKKYVGTTELGQKWWESVFKRLNFLVRKSTTAKPIIAPGLILEIGLTFYKSVNKAVNTYNNPAELIVNIDQTPLCVDQQIHNGRERCINSLRSRNC